MVIFDHGRVRLSFIILALGLFTVRSQSVTHPHPAHIPTDLTPTEAHIDKTGRETHAIQSLPTQPNALLTILSGETASVEFC